MYPDVKAFSEENSKNAGFTLVEILAVLVVLGILTTITVPTVLWIIENSREDVFML
ncbi:type II secretion system GspH family protein [Mesobacillus maritimus]|uniref:type II secretion system protein n=1 Tax=Mesobacillus maritimus TaxID=1643336 RepID=UPI00203D5291|nr:type II secretion system GspH family protein [Mesobacillus maritimus]